MKQEPLIILFAASFFATTLPAQHLIPQRIAGLRGAGTSFRPVSLFTLEAPTAANTALWRDACRTAEVLRYDEAAAGALIASAPAFITLEIPSANGTVHLDLERAEVLADGFTLRRASDGRAVEPPAAAHYRGMVRGDMRSVVSISVFGDHLMGLLADDAGQRVIGPFEQGPPGLHVLYNDRDLLGTNPARCGTDELTAPEGHGHAEAPTGERTTHCVRWYWEATYEIYQDKGSVANTIAYLTGLFNESATLFANDGVAVGLLELFVWDMQDPYDGQSSSARLNQFGDLRRDTYSSDMAHLIDYSDYGGVAWISTLCAVFPGYTMAYSGITSSYSEVPTYSWSTLVVTHEQGHNLGSPHTHACAWNGDNTAIDGCGPLAGASEGCDAPLPENGGTIMSYCHLIEGTGVNFNNGFGPQPAQLIVDEVNTAACLGTCAPPPCPSPGQPSATVDTTGLSATLHWPDSGAPSYRVYCRPLGLYSGFGITANGITGTEYHISGLWWSTTYEYRVAAACTTWLGTQFSHSVYSFFTTPDIPPGIQGACDQFEPNDNTSTATPIPADTQVVASIAAYEDYDCFEVTLADSGWLRIELLPGTAIFDLYLYKVSDQGVFPVAQDSYQTHSGPRDIVRKLSAGTYIIGVASHPGSFDTLQCYMLSLAFTEAVPPGPPEPPEPGACDLPPTNVHVSDITDDQVTVHWDTLPGIPGGYMVRVVNQFFGVSYTDEMMVSGLQPLTTYHVQVGTNCHFDGNGTYSDTVTFTTPACPDVMEPNDTWQDATDIGSAVSDLPYGGTEMRARIVSPADVDHYTFTTQAVTDLLVGFSLAPDHEIALLDSTGAVIVSSTTTDGEASIVQYAAPPGMYGLRMAGLAGAYGANGVCYQYSVRSVACLAPSVIAFSNILYNGATVSWPSMGTATAYELQWAPINNQNWTTVSGISTNSHVLTGLSQLSTYRVRVRAICGSDPESAYSPTGTFTTAAATCEEIPPIPVRPKIVLEGPYDPATGLMSDALRAQGLLPLTEPYTAMGLPVTGATSTSAAVLAVTGNNAIVDWVVVELRNPSNGVNVLERKAALLQRDGDVTALDGTSPVGFCLSAGSWRVAVRHRNHLGIMTSSAIGLIPPLTVIDLRSAAQGTYGTNARKSISGAYPVQALWAGDASGNGEVKYTGTANDRDPVLTTVGSNTPNNTVSGTYSRMDVNMNGQVKYAGSANDRDPILINVGHTTPNNTRSQQLP